GAGVRARAAPRGARRSRVGPRADARGRTRARAGRPARLGGADGLWLRRLLRLRRRDRRRAPAPVRRRASPAGGRVLRLLNASGCLDALAAPEVARSLDVFVTKTVTPLPREGNAPVRIAEVDVGMLNAIGLANPGVEAFTAEHLPRLAELGVPLWVSVGGFAVDDYVAVAEQVSRDEVEALELNLSCPNVDEVPENVGEVVAAVRKVTAKPLYAKLSAAVADLAATAR